MTGKRRRKCEGGRRYEDEKKLYETGIKVEMSRTKSTGAASLEAGWIDVFNYMQRLKL